MSQQVNVRVIDDAQADLIRRIARALRDDPAKARHLQAVLDDSGHANRLDDLEARLAKLERAMRSGEGTQQAARTLDTHRQDTSAAQAAAPLLDDVDATARPGADAQPQQRGAGRGKPLSQAQVDWMHQRYQAALDAGDTRGVKAEISRTLVISQSAVTRRLKLAGFD